MEDIEFLQHCGGMNPGERFYKMAPHLKPKEEVKDDDEIIRIKASLKPGFDASKYFVTEYTFEDFLNAVADEIRRESNGKAYTEKDSCDIQERQSKILS